MNLKEIIQKIFEPNYIKIYKQIERAFFNEKKNSFKCDGR